MGFFDVYDQYILNIMYDPRVRPGMTRQEIASLLPEVIPTVRAWIAETNALPQIDARNVRNGQLDNCHCAPTTATAANEQP